MGTWGPGIFSDDTAGDVRDAWRDALMDGLDDEAATARVFEQLGDVFEDPDDRVVAWTALAAAQSQTGRLQPAIRDRALELIEAGGDLELWREEPTFAKQREKALAKLAEKLRGPQPAPKTLKRPKPLSTNLETGDVIHLRGERGEALYVVIETIQVSYGTCPVVAELLWEGGEIPDRDTLMRLPLLHDENPISLNQITRPVQHLWRVDDPSRGNRALRNFGRVVARGVSRPDAADVIRDQARGFADGPSISAGGWDTLAAFIGYPWHQRLVETTRRVYGL